MWIKICERFWCNWFSKVISNSSNELLYTLDIIILGADEAYRTLPRILSQASHADKWTSDWLKVLWILFAPESVHLLNIDGGIEVFLDERGLKLRQILIRIRFYFHLDLLWVKSFQLDAVLLEYTSEHLCFTIDPLMLPPIEALAIQQGVL